MKDWKIHNWREGIWLSDKQFDAHALIECIDPDWRDHGFLTPHTAIDFYAEDMTQKEFMAHVKESNG